jgi:hypothetical protein
MCGWVGARSPGVFLLASEHESSSRSPLNDRFWPGPPAICPAQPAGAPRPKAPAPITMARHEALHNGKRLSDAHLKLT